MLSDATVWMDASSTCLHQAMFMDNASGHHYFLTGAKSRDDTQADCVTFGGHLVKIETSVENTFLTGHIPAGTGYVWIGLHAATGTSTYTWMDGTPLGSYDDFVGAPPIATTDCVNSNGTWSTYLCSQGNHGVCECE